MLLRRFLGGQITNDTFCDAAFAADDPIIDAIFDSAWVFYDDLKAHKLIGKHRPSAEERRMIQRWILFLDSDLPYVWPVIPMPGIDPHYRRRARWGAAFSLTGILSAKVDGFLAAGHYPVWPFRTMREYRCALAKPRRLAGSKPL
jgi:hypothetical protein